LPITQLPISARRQGGKGGQVIEGVSWRGLVAVIRLVLSEKTRAAFVLDQIGERVKAGKVAGCCFGAGCRIWFDERFKGVEG